MKSYVYVVEDRIERASDGIELANNEMVFADEEIALDYYNSLYIDDIWKLEGKKADEVRVVILFKNAEVDEDFDFFYGDDAEIVCFKRYGAAEYAQEIAE